MRFIGETLDTFDGLTLDAFIGLSLDATLLPEYYPIICDTFIAGSLTGNLQNEIKH